MAKLKFLSAALIAVAALLATPAMAREGHARSRHLAESADSSATPGAHYIGEAHRFRGDESHDVWGHWGAYYGPMIPSVP